MFTFPAELTIANAEQFKEALLAYQSEESNFSINDEAVVKIDTIGVQLIIVTLNYLLSLNKTIEWQCKSPVVRESIAKLGVKDPMVLQFLDAQGN